MYSLPVCGGCPFFVLLVRAHGCRWELGCALLRGVCFCFDCHPCWCSPCGWVGSGGLSVFYRCLHLMSIHVCHVFVSCWRWLPFFVVAQGGRHLKRRPGFHMCCFPPPGVGYLVVVPASRGVDYPLYCISDGETFLALLLEGGGVFWLRYHSWCQSASYIRIRLVCFSVLRIGRLFSLRFCPQFSRCSR